MMLVGVLFGAAALTYGIGVLRPLVRVSKDLEISMSGRIHKLEGRGATLAIDVVMKNPGRGNLRLSHPYVKLYHVKTIAVGKTEDVLLASSEINTMVYELKPQEVLTLKPIYIFLPYSKLGSISFTLVRTLSKEGRIDLKTITDTRINDSFSKSDEAILEYQLK